MRFGTVKGGVLSPSRQRKRATKPLTVRAFLAVAARLARELRLVTPRARLGVAHGLAEAAEQPFRFRWAMNWRPFNQSSVGMCMSARPRPRMLCPHRGRAGRNPITSCSICRCCLSACTERLQSTSIRPNFLLESSIEGLGQLPDSSRIVISRRVCLPPCPAPGRRHGSCLRGSACSLAIDAFAKRDCGELLVRSLLFVQVRIQ
jgi:hypothetical protein